MTDQEALRRAENRALAEKTPHRRVRAKPITAGQTYMTTRRAAGRRMFFALDEGYEEDKNLAGYCYAVACARYGLQLHAATMMGNHKHDVVTDVRGELPAFKNSLHAKLAKAYNVKRSREGSIWDGGKSFDAMYPDDDALLDAMVYVAVNPVKAGLVKWAHLWPGFTTADWRWGETRTFHKPKGWFFDPTNDDLPDTIDLTLERPPIFLDMSDEELWVEYQRRIRERCKEIQADMKVNKRRFVGLHKLLTQNWDRAATSKEERFVRESAIRGDGYRAQVARMRNRAWEAEYAQVIDEVEKGNHDVVFPYGTWWMVRFAGMMVADGPL